MNKWIRSFILLLFALSTQWVQAQSVAKIGDTEYATLADAIAAVPTNGTETTITMIADETVESASGAALTIAANKNVVLDLNGKVISLSSHIANSGTLTIQDGNGNGKIASNAGYTIVNTNGTLTIKSGTYTNTATDLILQRGGNITINGGSFTSESTVINVQSIGEGHTLTITNGKFTAEKNDAIYVAASAPTVSISGGEFITKSYVANGNPAAATAFHVVSNCTGGTIAISGGTFRALSTVNGSRALNVGSNPGISVTGGDFYSNAKDGRSVSSRTDGILAGGTYDGMVYSNYVANGKFAYPNDAHSRYTIEDFDETRVNDLAVAKIGDTYYTSLEEVSSEITEGCTVTLLQDLNYSEEYTFYLLDNMTLDGNGHTLTGNIQIDCNNGSGVSRTGVTIKDTKFVNITADDGYVIRSSKQSGNFTVTGCTFDNTKGQAIQCTTAAGANVTITGNTFKNGTGSKRYINLYGTGTNDASEIDVVISGNIFYEETNTQNLRLNAFGANNNFDINGNYFEDPQHSLIEKFNSSKDSFEFTVCGLDETGNIDTASEQIYVATGATSEATIAPVTMVAQIGTQKYRTIDAAVEAANEGETIEVIADGDYKLPNLPKNVTIEGKADGEVSFTHTTAGSIASVPNGATFKNVTFYWGNVNYHGFQHAGTINMEGCTLDGKFFSYGDMNFTDCSFNQTNGDYHMWAYSGNLTYTDCTFTNSSTGKFINVYNESGATKYTVTANNCTFINNGSSNKAALNIKATSGTNLLAYDVIINNCSTEGSFPEASSSDALVVLNSIAQVDDRTASGVDNITVTQDGVLIYPATVAAIGETRYPTLQAAVDAAQQMGGEVTITVIDNISGETVTIPEVANFKLTIDGQKDANYTVDALIIVDGLRSNGGSTTNGASVTLQNIAFVKTTASDGIQASHYPHNLTIQDCTYSGFDNDKWFLNASVDGPLYGVTVKNVTVEKARLIYGNLADDAVFQDIVATNDIKVGFNVKTSGTALIENCQVTTGKYAFRDYSDGYAGTFTLKNNTFVSTSEESDEGVIVNRGGVVGTTHINVESGTYTGHVKVLNNMEGVLAISGGYFSEEFPQNYIAADLVAEGKVCVPASDMEGYFTVGIPHYVAQIGETKYVSLQAAVDAAQQMGGEQTVTVIDNISDETVTIPEVANFKLTIDGQKDANYTVDALIIVDGLRSNGGSTTNGASVTLQNIAFVKTTATDGIQASHYPHNLTIQDCTYSGFDNDKWFLNASVDGPLYGVTVKNVTVEKARLIYGNLADDAVFQDIVATNDIKVGFNVKTSGTALIENCQVTTGKYAFRDYSDGYAGTFTLRNNTFVSTSEESDEGVIVNRGGVVGTTHINVESGTYTGHVKVLNNKEGVLAISGGYFSEEFPQNYIAADLVAQGKVCAPATDMEGYFTVGDPHYVAQIGETKYVSLAAAVDAAQANDVIEMIDDDNVSLTTAGSEVTIDKPLTITGAVDESGKPKYTIFGSANGALSNSSFNDLFLSCQTGTVTISNLKFDGFGNEISSVMGHSPIFIGGRNKNAVIENVYISNLNCEGIHINGGTFEIKDCNIDCSKTTNSIFTKGICVVNDAEGTIENTTITGVDCDDPNDTSGAIELQGSGDIAISGCTIESNTIGIATTPVAELTAGTSQVTISDCTITSQNIAVYSNGDKGALTSISSGRYSGLLMAGDNDEGLSISGGVFDDEPLQEYCAEGYAPADNTDAATMETYPYTVVELPDVAQIGDVKYKSLQAALDAAHEMTGNVTITLLDNISGYSIVHQKAGVNITIDGADKTVNGQIIIDGDARASGTETLTIKNVKFEGNKSDFCTGTSSFIEIPNLNTSGTPYYTGKNYNYAHNITVKDCSFTSTSSNDPEYDVVGIKATSNAGCYNVVIENATGTNLHSLAQLTGTTGGAVTNCTVTASESFVNVNGGAGEFTVSGNTFTSAEGADGYGVRENGSSSATINLSGNTFTAASSIVLGKGNSATAGTINVESGVYTGAITKTEAATGTIAISGGYFSVEFPQEYIAAELVAQGKVCAPATDMEGYFTVGDPHYVAQIGETKYVSLAEAVAAVPTDGTETTIVMIDNEMINVVGSAITIAKTKNIILDLNGYQVVGTASQGSTSALITNSGTLTIKDSSDTNADGNGSGKLISGATTTWIYEGDGNYAGSYASNTISNAGTLTIESGYIENISTGSATYAVDNNSSGADAILNVKGGVVKAHSVAVRQFANSTTKENIVNVEGGKITAGYSGIWIQLPGSDASKAMKANLNVTGGILEGGSYAFYDYSYGNAYTATQFNLAGGTFNGDIFSFGANINITDGTYNGEVAVNQAKASIVTVSGGKFAGDVYTYGANASKSFISGGVFAINTYEYEGEIYDCDWLYLLADGLTVVDNTDEATKDEYPYTVGPAEIYQSWIENGNKVGIYSLFTTPFVTDELYDGDFIDLLKDITLTSDVACQLESGAFTLTFGDFTIDRGGYSVSLKPGASVNTDKQTDIFSAAEPGYIVLETVTADGYNYSLVYVPASSLIVFHDSGNYEQSFEVPIYSRMAGADIYYKVNGGDAQKYTDPLAISEDTELEAWLQVGDTKVGESITRSYAIVEKPVGPSVADNYYYIKNNGNGKYVNVAGRKTVTFKTKAEAEEAAGAVVRVKAAEGGAVETLRSQAIDLPGYAKRAMNYVPEMVQLIVSKLHADGGGNILGENGVDAIMTKFNESFDYNLYLEEYNGGYRIYGRTPSMKPVVDFYAENKYQVDAKLPELETFINNAIEKLKGKLNGRGENILKPFSVEAVWEAMGGTLTKPEDAESTARFYEEVLASENNVWSFAYETAMMYYEPLMASETFKGIIEQVGDYKKYLDKLPNVRPNFKYYIVADGDKVDFISEGNPNVDTDYGTWTLEDRSSFTVKFEEADKLVDGEGTKYYTTLYTDFAYTMPENAKAYYVTGYDDTDIADLEEISGVIPAQTPVLLMTQDEGLKATLELSKEAGTAPTTNLLKGADWIVNDCNLQTMELQALFAAIIQTLGTDFYSAYIAQYEHLLKLNAGTVNNKYFFGLKDSYMEDVNNIRQLGANAAGKLGFWENFNALPANKAFLIEEPNPVFIPFTLDNSSLLVFHDSGTYEESLDVQMFTKMTDADIYYKLGDGTAIKYTGPVNISETTTLEAWLQVGDTKVGESVIKEFTIVEKPVGPSVADNYYYIKNNGNGKYVNVAGRKTVTFKTKAEAEEAAGAVIRVYAAEGGAVETLRSQAIDLPGYAKRAMNYVPEMVQLIVSKLHADGGGNILGENGVDAIMKKFNDSFDYNLYLEEYNGGYRIYGRTPSMKPVVDFYAENKYQVDAKLPELETFINNAIEKLKGKLNGRGENILKPFSVEAVWEAMGGTLTKPEDAESTARFYEEVLASENNVWSFAYETAMMYYEPLMASETFKGIIEQVGDYKKYLDKLPNVRPNFKYYIVADGDKVDFISEGNPNVDTNYGTWTLEDRSSFTVKFDEADKLIDGLGTKYYTTLYTDFAYEMPENAKAYYVIGYNAKDIAELEEISGVIPAQTPVLLMTQDEGLEATLKLSKEAGTAPTTNLLKGADWIVNDCNLQTMELQALFAAIIQTLGTDFYSAYIAKYEHLLMLNAGTVNNKYFFGLKDSYMEDVNNIRQLGANAAGKLGFWENFNALPANKAFLIEEPNPVLIPLWPDVNCDGYINVADVTALVAIVLDNDVFGPDWIYPYYNHNVADVNQDGLIGIADITELVGIVLDIEEAEY